MARGGSSRRDARHHSDEVKRAFCEAYAVTGSITRACERATEQLGLVKPLHKATADRWLDEPKWQAEVRRCEAALARARAKRVAARMERLERVKDSMLEGLEESVATARLALR